jgi:hypothetical protein
MEDDPRGRKWKMIRYELTWADYIMLFIVIALVILEAINILMTEDHPPPPPPYPPGQPSFWHDF